MFGNEFFGWHNFIDLSFSVRVTRILYDQIAKNWQTFGQQMRFHNQMMLMSTVADQSILHVGRIFCCCALNKLRWESKCDSKLWKCFDIALISAFNGRTSIESVRFFLETCYESDSMAFWSAVNHFNCRPILTESQTLTHKYDQSGTHSICIDIQSNKYKSIDCMASLMLYLFKKNCKKICNMLTHFSFLR